MRPVNAEESWNDALEEGARSAGASLVFLNACLAATTGNDSKNQ